ncbi:hypothetical protein CCHL11_04599 [Colletotrichum chlorophyti]|uniref:BZIP domain-containing protein n=1 Tax=Colletotrichum chlorophyti TaxID=708187 RepID=A0A1Q8RRA3_9PEZI|nr:hypothetical protein CCHL11_04599 [Colletotrichum chlorophyti]
MSSEQDYQDLFGPQAKKAKRGRLQTDKSANAIRIRDNQRRSRARHKEFVDELQRKVQEYEKRGIEASLQMQKAARDVAIENSRLRALLASRGVSAEQVDAYLRSFEDESKGSPSVSMSTTLAPILNAPIVLEPSPTQLPPLQEHFSKTRFPPEQENDNAGTKRKFGETLLPPVLTLTPTPDVQQNSAMDRLAVLADASLHRSTTQPNHAAHPAPEQQQPPPPPPPRNYVHYNRRSQTPPRPADPNTHPSVTSPLEMSCNTAARIITEMQGHGDERATRLALGCRSQEEDCFVKNTSVFRVLDHR